MTDFGNPAIPGSIIHSANPEPSLPDPNPQNPGGVPPHFHNDYRVQEKDLIPNGAYIDVVPDWEAPEGTQVQYLNGNDFRIYKMLDGTWREVSGTKIDTIQTYAPSADGTATLDLSLGNIHHITMPAGNITIAISNETPGQCFIIRILQDGSGGRTVTWFSTIKWAGGVAPTLTTTGSKADTFGFEVTLTDNYDGFIVGQNI